MGSGQLLFCSLLCPSLVSLCEPCPISGPRSLEAEVSSGVRRAQQLEAYLGGELPQEGSGVTWREEREGLVNTVSVSMFAS